MDRYNRGAGSASAPSAPASPANPFFTEGNPTLGVPATQPGPWWFHMMTEELRAVIVAAGLTPDHTDVTQLTQAIAALISDAQRAVILDSAAFEASVTDGEVVYWDSANSRFDEALADGTAKQNAVGIADVTNSKVYAFGSCPLLSGLTPGSRYYLSGSVAGALTTTAPASNIVTLGIAKSATDLVVDIDGDAYVISSDAEAQAFTAGKLIDGAKLRTALKGPNQSLTAAGYQKWMGDLIIQWGSFTTNASGDTSVSYPIAFPAFNLKQYVSLNNATLQNYSVGMHTPTLSGMSIKGVTSANAGAVMSGQYLVIGY
jgi:hypothetical protein